MFVWAQCLFVLRMHTFNMSYYKTGSVKRQFVPELKGQHMFREFPEYMFHQNMCYGNRRNMCCGLSSRTNRRFALFVL